MARQSVLALLGRQSATGSSKRHERPSASVGLMTCGIVSGYSPPRSSVSKVRPVPSIDGSCGRFSGVIFSYLRVSLMACLSSNSADREIGNHAFLNWEIAEVVTAQTAAFVQKGEISERGIRLAAKTPPQRVTIAGDLTALA